MSNVVIYSSFQEPVLCVLWPVCDAGVRGTTLHEGETQVKPADPSDPLVSQSGHLQVSIYSFSLTFGPRGSFYKCLLKPLALKLKRGAEVPPKLHVFGCGPTHLKML